MILARKFSLAAVARIPHRLNLALITALTLILLGFFLHTELALTGGELGVPLDDAWIHYQFARNLSQGQGFSYNAGEPTPGSTAPLWTLLLALVGLFSGDFLVSSLILSAIFLLLTVGLSYGLAFSLTASRPAALLAALGVALSGRMLWAGLAGMETTAFAAISLAAVWVYTRRGLRPGTALLFGLASQLRPEGHALFALAMVDTGWNVFTTEARRARRKKREVRREKLEERASHFSFLVLLSVSRRLIIPLLVYGLVSAPYAIFSLATTGKPLPNTFYAKVGTEHLFSWRTLRETIALHWYDNPISLLLLPLGLAPTWRRSRLTVLWLLGLPLLTAVVIDFTWHHGRYTMPLIPFQMIVAAIGADWLLKRLEIGDWGLGIRDWQSSISNLQSPIPILAVVLSLFFLLGGLWQVPRWATMLGHNANEILEIDVALGRWLAANTPPDALIAVDDIGAIAFLSGRRIVDLNGLVSPEMWPAVKQPVGLARDQVTTRILSGIQPDYLVAFPLWHWAIVSNPAVVEPIHRVETSTHTIIFGQEAFVYRPAWPYGAEFAATAVGSAVLGNGIQLQGYDLQLPREPEHPVELTLYWHSLNPVATDYDVFIHVLDDSGQIVAQIDQEPVRGLAPTSLWQPGDTIGDTYQLMLPPELPAGAYAIYVGMYRRETGERLSASSGSGISDNAILLATFNRLP